MKKELLNCINNITNKKRKEQHEKEKQEKILREQRELTEKLEREYLLKQIYEFFKGFYPDRGFSFPLQWSAPRDPDDKEVTYEQPYRDYKTIKLKEFEGIGFNYINFGYDHQRGELYIQGNSTDPFDMDIWNNDSYYYRKIGRHDNNVLIDYQDWNNKRLKIFINALPWIEDYIAKEYGCSQSHNENNNL